MSLKSHILFHRVPLLSSAWLKSTCYAGHTTVEKLGRKLFRMNGTENFRISSRGCPVYWKLALENVVPKATGSSRKFRPDVWRLVVKVVDESSKFVVQTFLFSTHFQRLIVFQQRTKGQNCKFFTRKSQKRLEQKQNQTNLLFDFPHRDTV